MCVIEECEVGKLYVFHAVSRRGMLNRFTFVILTFYE